ncbi:MAG: hypothetical protein KatS3mg078_1862 [Deltaproteobacteria bacterium]|jgi:hypothetical protein|nr:MAG: hypothetical protein KatS3mg078_1862 [Deltaproteobacteria bacterium]
MERKKGILSLGETLNEIQYLKKQIQDFSWLIGEELTEKLIETLDEKENDVIENAMWWTT